MAWRHNPSQYKSSQVVLAAILAVFLAIALISTLLVRSHLQKSQDNKDTITDQQIAQPETAVIPEPLVQIADPAAPVFDMKALQAALDAWVASQSGVASVVVSDPVSGDMLAVHNADQAYFTASIYKLYVAYEGYRAVDAGDLDPAQDYINGNTLAECLDIMIRESDSPCAEKLWAGLGKPELNTILESYGLTDTDMVGLRTTAADTAIVLQRVATGEGLSDASQQAMLDSMQNQVFRDALNKGFSSDVTVYNKIGFNELIEYHDTAIIELENGDRLVVSVLTERIGTTQIAALGATIEAALQ